MSRIVWHEGAAIEVHYQSPHEFVKDIETESSPERLFLETEKVLPAGSQRPLILHIGFVARELRLNGRVEAAKSPAAGRPTGILLTLLGPDGCASAELRSLIQQIQQGMASQAAAGAVPTTGSQMAKERQLLTMPATFKMMHAIKANKEDRLILATDVDPRSIEFLLKNPGMTLQEIRTLSARPTLTTAHIQTIVAHSGWKKDDQVRLNLARNPKLPDMLVESILDSLTLQQLKIVAGSQTITATTKRVVHRILQTRGQ